MTGREYASDIQLILQRSTVSKDSRIRLQFILSRMAVHRAKVIHDAWKRAGNDDINNEWIQNMGVCNFTAVNSSDDPNVPVGCKNFGKFTIPEVVAFPNDRGVFRVSSASKYNRYYPIEPDRIFDLVEGTERAKFRYVTRIQTALYTNKYERDLNVLLVLLNPMDGFVLNTEEVTTGNLIYANDFRAGETYIVSARSIVHNGVTYGTGQTFIAVTPDFTGNGVVKFANQKRRMTIDDPYPMSGDTALEVAMNIWTKDFQIEKQEVADIINDAQDQVKALQPV